MKRRHAANGQCDSAAEPKQSCSSLAGQTVGSSSRVVYLLYLHSLLDAILFMLAGGWVRYASSLHPSHLVASRLHAILFPLRMGHSARRNQNKRGFAGGRTRKASSLRQAQPLCADEGTYLIEQIRFGGTQIDDLWAAIPLDR